MKRMRKILDSNVFWLVISFLISLSVWVYVTSVETVESTKVFRNIPVEITGEETLLNMRDMVITDVDTPTVTVEIRGPRRVVNALEDSDLVAQVDVSKLSQAAYTSLNYTIVYPSGTDRRNLTIISKSQDTINFMVSKLTSKPIPVNGGFEGSTAEGYISGTPSFEPSTIYVSGPEVYLKNIDHAYVSFGKDITLESTYSVDVGYTLLDANDEPCSTTDITVSQDTVRATLPVQAVKDVPLSISVIEGAGATSDNTRITINPKVIRLAGDAAVLSEINQITLDTVDLTTFATEYSETYPIPVPNGVRNLTGVTEATVSIEIVGVTTKTFYIDEFNWLGLDEDMELTAVSESIPVLLRGPSETIPLITKSSIRAEADLTELNDAIGNHFVTVRITVPNYSEVGAIQVDEAPDYTVAIHLARKEVEE